MKRIGISTDSHSGIAPKEAKELGIMVLPMPFYIGEECYYEDISITREAFFTYLKEGQKVSTSQPSPEAVMELWREGGRITPTTAAIGTLLNIKPVLKFDVGVLLIENVVE